MCEVDQGCLTGTGVSSQPRVGTSTGSESSTAVNVNVGLPSLVDMVCRQLWLPLLSTPFMGQIPQIPHFTGEGHAAGDLFSAWYEQFENIVKLG